MAHTPKPWDTFGTAIFTDSRGFLCATSSGEGSSEEIEEAHANARLITAAPDLLEALKEMVEMCRHFDADADRQIAAFEQAESAIAKAEGR